MVEAEEETRRRLRDEARARRAQTPAGEHRLMSLALVERIMEAPMVQAASIVAGFWPVRGEPDILPALHRLKAQGRRVLLPLVVGDNLEFAEPLSFDRAQNPPGAMGIPEPSGLRCPISDIELFLVPGLVFDGGGGRLGYGKGFYDRALSAAAATTVPVGVTFASYVVAQIPTKSHDRGMHALITEASTIRCGD